MEQESTQLDFLNSESEASIEKKDRKKILASPKSILGKKKEKSKDNSIKNIRFDQGKLEGETEPQEESSSEELPEDKKDYNLPVYEVPAFCYEWLGLKTVEPTSGQPLLELTGDNENRVAWVARDCNSSAAMSRRALPSTALEAAFFDGLEVMRRVALSEVAKAKNSVEAVAVLGVVFDREALLLVAEEVYGLSKGREIVLGANPGNYDELVIKIA